MKLYVIIAFLHLVLFSCNPKPIPDSELLLKRNYTSIKEANTKPLDVYKLFVTNENVSLDVISKFKNLQRLSISGNVKIKEIPGPLVKLSNLQWLEIEETKIDSITYMMQYLNHLNILRLSNSSLKEFPRWICVNKNMIYLRLGNNSIKSVPRDIYQMESLTQLELNNNELTVLPLEIGELKNLNYLDISGNKIEKLPYTISNLYKNLQTLKLSQNNISNEEINWLKEKLPYTSIE